MAARVESGGMKILLAVDGSKASLDAVKNVIEHMDQYRERPTIELVTVHRPVPKLPGMGAAVGKSQIAEYYREEGEQTLAEARKLLDRARIPYTANVLVGEPAEAIVKHAKKAGVDQIAIGATGHSAVGKIILGSTATKVLQLASIPVLILK